MTWAEIQRSNCRAEIDSNNSTIRHYEQLYDSLRQFQGVVQGSHGAFMDTNGNKRKCLSDLTSGVKNCRTADRYSGHMGQVLDEIGGGCACGVYSALSASISGKLSEYLSKISSLEAENRSLRGTIASLNEQIRREEENRRREQERLCHER